MTDAAPVIRLLPGPGEGLCLAYANTLAWRGRTRPSESLGGIGDLLDWLGANAGWDAEAMRPSRAWAAGHEPAARELFGQAIALREAIYRALGGLAEAAPPPGDDLDRLNLALAEALPRARLAGQGGHCAWQVTVPRPAAAPLLSPVLWSAADLLTGGDHSRLRRCANAECLYLFIDGSTAGTRRWCDMGSCGNRLKARRHYARRRADRRPQPAG